MVEKAIDIWSYPVTTFVPEEKQFDTVTLDDDVNLTGSQIAKFAYQNTEQSVESWTDMYARVLQLLHSVDSSVLTGLAYTTDSSVELSLHVSHSPEAFNNKAQIASNIYVWTGTSTQHKLNTLRRFFSLFGADPQDLVFYLKEQGADEPSDETPERYDLRKRYWTYALPFIKEKFGEDGLFSNVNPTIANWISGFFGVGGFNISCTSNYDCARVQLYLGKSDKEKNKEAFDFLYARKQEIEEKLGAQFEWDRADNRKASFMTYELKGVSITNETDWTRMAKFQAEWARKICDVFLPILKELYPSINC